MKEEISEEQDIVAQEAEDIYSHEGTEDQLDNGEISSEEAGFMLGYNTIG